MARGALGSAINPELAKLFIERLEKVRLGENELLRITNKNRKAHLQVDFSGHSKYVKIILRDDQKRDNEFKEHVDRFPSETLIAQIILLCG